MLNEETVEKVKNELFYLEAVEEDYSPNSRIGSIFITIALNNSIMSDFKALKNIGY